MDQDWEKIVWKKPIQKKDIPKELVPSAKQKNKNNTINTVKKIYHEDGAINEEPDIKPILVGKQFGDEMQSRRIAKHLTQKDLAKALSIPLSIVNQYETGQGIRNGSYISKIRKYLSM